MRFFTINSVLVRFLLIAAVVLCLSSSTSECATIVRGPYLQLSTPESVQIVWRTKRGIDPIVRYGLTPDDMSSVVTEENILIRRSDDADDDEGEGDPIKAESSRTRQFEATLTGLKPNTVYHYAVYNGRWRISDKPSKLTFRTHPVSGEKQPMRFWVLGDSGKGNSAQKEVYRAMRKHVKEEKLPLDFMLHLGDMAYDKGKDDEFQDNFFDVYEDTLKTIVCWPTMGNHEGSTSKGKDGKGPYYDAYVLPTRAEAGGVPSGHEAYYSFDYGSVHFICLDSHDLNRSPTGAMARWLRLDLAAAKSDWLIAFWHHPPYTKGSHDSDKEKRHIEMRRYIMPILESAGVDLVLTGHSHIYERSMLIDGAYDTPTVARNFVLDDGDGDPDGDGAYRKSPGLNPNEGNIQIVAGNGGASLGRKGTSPVMRRIILEHGSVFVEIEEETLSVTMLNKEAEIRDRFSIVKNEPVSVERIADPWRPSEDEDGERNPDLSKDFVAAIPAGAEWRYLVDAHPKRDEWTELDFDHSDWKVGRAGFGYGDDDDETVLEDMRKNYSAVYIRREFAIESVDDVRELGLAIRYDDAFIAYLNGKEVLRRNVDGRGRKADVDETHSGDDTHYYKIRDFKKRLQSGRNVFAIEGHNVSEESSDFTLDPTLHFKLK